MGVKPMGDLEATTEEGKDYEVLFNSARFRADQWKIRAKKAERELACLKATPIYTRFYEAEKRIEELTGLWHNANERVEVKR